MSDDISLNRVENAEFNLSQINGIMGRVKCYSLTKLKQEHFVLVSRVSWVKLGSLIFFKGFRNIPKNDVTIFDVCMLAQK